MIAAGRSHTKGDKDMFRKLDGSDGKTRFQDIETSKVYNDLPDGGEIETQTETQEETKASILDGLLAKVDMSDPLEIVMDSGQILSITQEQFISYWLPTDATRSEKAKCFNETRAAGMNPAIRGDCHYFRTGGGQLSLYVGYHVYLRRAYANGLNHIHKPELIYDETTGKLESCIITLEIEGRPNFIWETWYSEVVAERNGVPNARWVKAERQMTIKSSLTNTFRNSGIATLGILPTAIEEMPDFPAPGYKNLTQHQLDTLGVEEGKAKLGPVTATDHQIDLTPLRRNYRGKIAEREIFVDDTQRKMWQSEIIGKASTADWDALDFNNATSEIESGRCEKWVQDNQPKPGPDKPSSGDDFLENSPNLPEEYQESGSDTQEQLFLAEASTRFATPEAREKWCLTLFLPPVPREKWSGTDYAQATKSVFVLPEIAAQNATDDTAQGGTQPETTEGQERSEDSPEWDITGKTRKRIGELLVELKIYNTPRSPEFKARIKTLIGRELLRMQSMTEAEGRAIVASLSEELEMIGTVEDEEPLEDGMMTPEDAKDEAFAQAYAASEREVERVASGEPPFQTTTEWAELNKAFNTRLYKHFQISGQPVFESPDAQLEWSAESTGVASTGQWLPEHFALANAGLDAMKVAGADAETPEQTGIPQTSEKQDNGLCTDGDFKELSDLFDKLLPKSQHAMGSKEAHDLIRDSKAVKGIFTRIKSLTTEEISDLKHYLNDLITHMEADAEERAQNAADAV